VCHTLCGLAIKIKTHLTAKEEVWKLKYFSMQKTNLIFKKNKKSSKRNQNPSRDIIITLDLISSFNTSKNIILFQKSSYNILDFVETTEQGPHPSPIFASSSSDLRKLALITKRWFHSNAENFSLRI
jgi:hypothetical protein